MGSEKLISINELTDKIIKISNKNIKKINNISKKLKNFIYINCSSKERFWMEAKIDLDIGIKKLLNGIIVKILNKLKR